MRGHLFFRISGNQTRLRLESNAVGPVSSVSHADFQLLRGVFAAFCISGPPLYRDLQGCPLSISARKSVAVVPCSPQTALFHPALTTVSGGLQPRQFRFEFEAQLRTFVLGQPVRHLRKDGAIERQAIRLPRHLLREACLQRNLVQVCANLVGIGAVDGRGLIAERSSCSSWPNRSPWWEEACRTRLGCRSCESCAISAADASRMSGLSPQPTDQPLALTFALGSRSGRFKFCSAPTIPRGMKMMNRMSSTP